MEYNNIQHWNYEKLPTVFGKNTWSSTVATERELESVLKEREKHSHQMALIILKMAKMDAPYALIKMSESVAARNHYSN